MYNKTARWILWMSRLSNWSAPLALLLLRFCEGLYASYYFSQAYSTN